MGGQGWGAPLAHSPLNILYPNLRTILENSFALHFRSASIFLSLGSTIALFGDSANVFGNVTNNSGFIAFSGDGFSLLLPAKWNPSKEKEFSNVALRYEDNFDAVNNLVLIKERTTKSRIEDYGSPEQFLNSITYLIGQQSYSGKTISEGGFAPDRVSAASVLDVDSTIDKKGKTYYRYNILSRTADGDEGGRHQLIAATVSSSSLFILKVQAGDKRWFKGVKKEAEGVFNSFSAF